MKIELSLLLVSTLLASVPSTIGQPLITIQPADQSVSLGANVTNQVTASGTAPLDYQWQFNGGLLTDATNRLLILTNIQLPQAGQYSVLMTDASGSATSKVATVTVDSTFTKITTGSIVTDRDRGWGCAWGDYDNDGFIDLVVSIGGSGSPGRCLFYHNSGDGTFTKMTNTPITSMTAIWNAAVWGDYDNDGFLDLFVGTDPGNQNRLYHNTGNGNFAEVVSRPGRDGDGGAAVWVDYDGDGFLDLAVGGWGESTKLYRNNRDGTFSKQVLAPATLPIGLVWNLYNNQGHPDLSVINNGDPNSRFQNKGDGTFLKLPSSQNAFKSGNYSSVVAADFRNSGYLDVFMPNGWVYSRDNDLFFRNNGDGTFTQLTSTNQVGDIVKDASPGDLGAAADYDNDGYLDLFVTNPGIGKNEHNSVYHNNRDGTFTRVVLGSLSGDSAESTGCAWGDYDNDGFMDLYVASGGGAENRGLQNGFLYRNNGNTNNWLKLKLVGTVSNRSAIGATVRLRATIRGKTFWQRRDVSGGGNLFSQDDQRPNFGLGDATNAEVVRIEWPSGIVQELQNIHGRQILTVNEPANLRITRPAEIQVRSWKGMEPRIQFSTNLVDWSPLTTLTVTNADGSATFSDPGAVSFPHLFYRAVLP